MKLSRRTMTRAVLGAPLVLAAASAAGVESLLAGQAEESKAPPAEPEEPPVAKFLARQEEGLSGDERKRVRRDVTGLEQALKQVRDFKIGNDVPPSGAFRAFKARRSHAR